MRLCDCVLRAHTGETVCGSNLRAHTGEAL